MTLYDLEVRIFAKFRWILQLWKPTMAKQINTDPTVSNRIVAH